MTAELAQQLKDAGFPQNNARGANPHAPTLSELITACDTCFYSLRHTPDGQWLASGRFAVKENQVPYYESAAYDEPDAAVAELFLAMRLHGRTEPPAKSK